MHVLYLLESIPKGDFRLPRTNVYYTLWEFEIARFVEVFEIEIFVSLKNTSVRGSLISASHDTHRQPRNVKNEKSICLHSIINYLEKNTHTHVHTK